MQKWTEDSIRVFKKAADFTIPTTKLNELNLLELEALLMLRDLGYVMLRHSDSAFITTPTGYVKFLKRND